MGRTVTSISRFISSLQSAISFSQGFTSEGLRVEAGKTCMVILRRSATVRGSQTDPSATTLGITQKGCCMFAAFCTRSVLENGFPTTIPWPSGSAGGV